MKDKSYLTAITRKSDPLPTRWLRKKGLIRGQVLDYGCGRCHAINPIEWDNYDPHYYLSILHSGYDTIICNYVLCVLPRSHRKEILTNIQSLLYDDGIAYISVRNDKPRQGWGKSSKGTYQGRVQNIKIPLLYECSSFRIYHLTKNTKLV
jgi:hypothetical protein